MNTTLWPIVKYVTVFLSHFWYISRIIFPAKASLLLNSQLISLKYFVFESVNVNAIRMTGPCVIVYG